MTAPFGRRSAVVVERGEIGEYVVVRVRDPSGVRPQALRSVLHHSVGGSSRAAGDAASGRSSGSTSTAPSELLDTSFVISFSATIIDVRIQKCGYSNADRNAPETKKPIRLPCIARA